MTRARARAETPHFLRSEDRVEQQPQKYEESSNSDNYDEYSSQTEWGGRWAPFCARFFGLAEGALLHLFSWIATREGDRLYLGIAELVREMEEEREQEREQERELSHTGEETRERQPDHVCWI